MSIVAESKSRVRDGEGSEAYWRARSLIGSDRLLIRLRAEFDANMSPPKGWKRRKPAKVAELPIVYPVIPEEHRAREILIIPGVINEIQQFISTEYKVSRRDLLSVRRARAISHPRQIGMYLAKELTDKSLPDIGRRFGGRDHSTVIHAHRKISRMVLKDADFAREIAMLIAKFTGEQQ